MKALDLMPGNQVKTSKGLRVVSRNTAGPGEQRRIAFTDGSICLVRSDHEYDTINDCQKFPKDS